jgi:HEPN domain-containing protein
MDRNELIGLSDAEFNDLLRNINKNLREQNVPLPGRALKGWLEFSTRFNLSLSIVEPLSKRVLDWFNDYYGDKLKIDYAYGSVPLLVRGDLYLLNIPRMWGSVKFYLDAENIGAKETGFGPVNVLSHIEGMTSARAKSLSLDERRSIFYALKDGATSLSVISAVSDAEAFVIEARADVRAASQEIRHNFPHYGAAKWSILQAAEKFLKSFLEKKGIAYKKTHILADHAARAEAAGLAVIPRALLDDVQCEASVRYEATLVSQSDLVKAFYSGLRICAHVAESLDHTDSAPINEIRLVEHWPRFSCGQIPAEDTLDTYLAKHLPHRLDALTESLEFAGIEIVRIIIDSEVPKDASNLFPELTKAALENDVSIQYLVYPVQSWPGKTLVGAYVSKKEILTSEECLALGRQGFFPLMAEIPLIERLPELLRLLEHTDKVELCTMDVSGYLTETVDVLPPCIASICASEGYRLSFSTLNRASSATVQVFIHRLP